jgi:hypothetical protein
MGPNTESLSMLNGRSMYWSPVTKQHLIGYPIFPIHAIQETAQRLRSPTKTDRVLAAPVQLIADIEIHLEHRVAICVQSCCQPSKEWRAHALQEQKPAFQLISSVFLQHAIIHEHF